MADAKETKSSIWRNLKWPLIVSCLCAFIYRDAPSLSDLSGYDVAKYLGITLFLFVFWFLEKSGFWVKPKIERRTTPAVTAIFKRYTGPYDNAGKAYQEAFSVLEASLDKRIKRDVKSFALYFDDPYVVKPEKLQYIVGVCGENLSKETVSLYEKRGYEITSLPGGVPCLYTKFPVFYPGINPLNIIFAVSRVYEAIYKDLPNSKVMAFEICDLDYTHFYLPIPANEEQEKLFSLGYKKLE